MYASFCDYIFESYIYRIATFVIFIECICDLNISRDYAPKSKETGFCRERALKILLFTTIKKIKNSKGSS